MIPHYQFERGFPTPEAVQKAYDDIDLNRAVQAYRFFYPTVSFAAAFRGLEKHGAASNRTAMLLQGNPKQLVFTANSDTPYGILPIDLRAGPIVIELPPGPLIAVVNDLNQRFVMDMGLPGPDKGKGGKHLIIPPQSQQTSPPGYYTGTPTTFHVSVALRALPVEGDRQAAIELLKAVKVYPLDASKERKNLDWIDITDKPMDLSPLEMETKIGYWQILHTILRSEPVYEAYRHYYGELAALGIVKDKDFRPDARMKSILENAAQIGNEQMRVQAFADRRPDRFAWPDRKWEWVTLRPENGTFDTPSFVDLEAREKWFYQAIIESPAMFARKEGTGSLYWLGAHDQKGLFLDGGKTYRLRVPMPIPAKLFWSVTVYDPFTRSEIQTSHNKAALSSLYDLVGHKTEGSAIDLHFGPKPPAGKDTLWLQTLPDRGWFCYFRIYGPEQAAFNGNWKLNDFEEIVVI